MKYIKYCETCKNKIIVTLGGGNFSSTSTIKVTCGLCRRIQEIKVI